MMGMEVRRQNSEMVKRIRVGIDGLQTARPRPRDRQQEPGSVFRMDLENQHHERDDVVLLEPFQPLFRS